MNKKAKILAAFLVAITLTSVITWGYALANEKESSEKEEVIYGVLSADGTVQEVIAVNILTAADGKVIDYGNYSEIKNLTTADKLTDTGGIITGNVSSSRIYYRGVSKTTVLPWIFSISYYLDGIEKTASEILGTSGDVKIRISISNNPECDISFYNSYALQLSLVLDTSIFTGITADGATIANSGRSKQINIIHLPGNDKIYSVTAKCSGFEMDSISINGIRMAMALDPDTDALTAELSLLASAVARLNGGAAELSDGSSLIYQGSDALSQGGKKLLSGVDSLNSGAKELKSAMDKLALGMNQITADIPELSAASGEIYSALKKISSLLSTFSFPSDSLAMLVQASGEINDGFQGIAAGVTDLNKATNSQAYRQAMLASGLDIEELLNANSNMLESLEAKRALLQEQYDSVKELAGYEAQAEALAEQLTELHSTIALIQANNAAVTGAEAYINAIGSGLSTMSAGIDKLASEYSAFNSGIIALTQQLTDAAEQLTALTGAVTLIKENYGLFDEQINLLTEGLTQAGDGYTKLVAGLGELVSGSAELKGSVKIYTDSVTELSDGIESLKDGAKTLADGVSLLNESLAGMNDTVSEKISDMISELLGSDEPIKSFTSEKNNNVTSVQFILKTEEIKAPAIVPEVKPEEQLSFWQKLLRLFGINS